VRLNASSAKDDDANLGEVFEFLRVLWATAHALETRSLAMQKEIGLSWPQRLVIRLIGRFPGVTPSRLAEILYLHPSTLSIQLKRLEERRLVERRVDPTDGRRAFLWLTKGGSGFDVDTPNTIEASVDALMHAVARADIARTKRVLETFAEHLFSLPPPRRPAPSRRARATPRRAKRPRRR
jgi:DNA-binding MarR family transcriptional regulator